MWKLFLSKRTCSTETPKDFIFLRSFVKPSDVSDFSFFASRQISQTLSCQMFFRSDRLCENTAVSD